jgi:hypothetical protein
MEPTSPETLSPIADNIPLEDLGLSVRARNALKSVGCSTVGDVLRLDLDRPLRGLGKFAREELLVKLDRAGFPHPCDVETAGEITRLERSLERIEHRIDSVLGGLSREIRAARHRLRKLRTRPSSTP